MKFNVLIALLGAGSTIKISNPVELGGSAKQEDYQPLGPSDETFVAARKNASRIIAA